MANKNIEKITGIKADGGKGAKKSFNQILKGTPGRNKRIKKAFLK
jgi:hypothetical protein